jgi:calcineurin-like phosphoesterase family protein
MNLPGVYDTFNKLWDGYQTIWITSDLHFSDEDLRKGFPNRPSDEELVKRINAKVGRRDILVILGDCGNQEFVKQLRGYKILIAGNHEPGLSVFKDFIQEIYSGPLMIGEKILLSHEPVDVPWAVNIHGHDHTGRRTKGRINVCLDANDYEPVNMNQLLKSGIYKDVKSIHRATIDKATERRKKRGYKLGGKK